MSATWTIEHEVRARRDAVALLHGVVGDGARLEGRLRFRRLAVERDLDDRGQAVAERLAARASATRRSITPASRRRLTRRRQVGGEMWTRSASAWLVSDASRWSWSRSLRSMASMS